MDEFFRVMNSAIGVVLIILAIIMMFLGMKIDACLLIGFAIISKLSSQDPT